MITTKHLVIDGKNLLYRAVFAAAYDKYYQKSGKHTVNLVLHFLSHYLNKFNPEQIHVFWDSPRNNTWRKNLVETYKEGRNASSRMDPKEVSGQISELVEVSSFLFRNIGIRQYYKDNMEADDLIYAFCKINKHDDIIIVSSDSDLKQISYNFKNVKIHSHLSKEKKDFEDVPDVDPVLMKCFVGDKSDNIKGYHRIGPVKARVLVEDLAKRDEFFKSDNAKAQVNEEIMVVGDEQFKNNLLLIDLSLCPYLLENMMHVFKRQFKPICFDLNSVRELINKYKLKGVTSDLSRYVTPFNRLVKD